MADLDALDPTQPDGAIITVSQLDDFIRETRQKIKDWALVEHSADGHHDLGVGTIALEHTDIGRHKIPIGSTAARNAYFVSPGPVNGNIWFINDSPGLYKLQVYHAGAWRDISFF
jgi:hypothetical protein